VRYKCGEMLAKADINEPGNTPDDANKLQINFVAGIPDSGVGHALGYSNTRHIPYMRPYVKYTPTWPRSFMPQNQTQRELVAKMKLIPNEDIIKERSGVFLDDSIVRGTQLRDNVQDLVECGIKDVHMRIACPPLVFPCEFLNFSRSRSSMELATHKAVKMLIAQRISGNADITEEEIKANQELQDQINAEIDQIDWSIYANPDTPEYQAMVDEIRKELGLTTLKFQKLDDLVEAIGLPKCKLCTHCFDGSSWGHK
jgi:amidophosphoribosyltransferase